MLKNKKAAENTAIFSTANSSSFSQRTFTLSDKIRILYRYFRLSAREKGLIIATIDSIYLYNTK